MDVVTMNFGDLLDPRKRQRIIEEARLRRLFSGRDHAREIWDAWDGISDETPNGEDAHAYLNLIGDGEYCAV